jgi:hypothetical protein
VSLVVFQEAKRFASLQDLVGVVVVVVEVRERLLTAMLYAVNTARTTRTRHCVVFETERSREKVPCFLLLCLL